MPKPTSYLTPNGGVSFLEFVLIIAIACVLVLIVFDKNSKAEEKVCIAEKTVGAILTVTRYETIVRYTDGTTQRMNTQNGVSVGDKKCLAYQ